MTISLILRIAIVGIVVSIIGHVIDNAGGRKEYTMLVGLCAFLLVLYWVMPCLKDLFQTIETMVNYVS